MILLTGKNLLLDFRHFLPEHDVATVGGKNSSLGEMISQLAATGVRVPGGFATTAHAFRQFLAHSGLTDKITEAASGAEAVAATARIRYDVVLMDCQMPDIDGLAATRIIRKREREASNGAKRHLPIIALTAGIMPEQQERCFEAGMDAVLAKPLRIDELAETLRKHLPPPPAIDDETLQRIAQDAGRESVPILLASWLGELDGQLAMLAQAGDSETRRAAAPVRITGADGRVMLADRWHRPVCRRLAGDDLMRLAPEDA